MALTNDQAFWQAVEIAKEALAELEASGFETRPMIQQRGLLVEFIAAAEALRQPPATTVASDAFAVSAEARRDPAED